MAFVDEWLAQPYVRAVGPGQGHWAILRNLLRDSGTAGNLTSDAPGRRRSRARGFGLLVGRRLRALPRRRARQPAALDFRLDPPTRSPLISKFS